MEKLQEGTKGTCVFEVHVESWKAIPTYLGLQVDEPSALQGDTCGTRRRGSPGGCGCSTLPIGTSQLLERSNPRPGQIQNIL